MSMTQDRYASLMIDTATTLLGITAVDIRSIDQHPSEFVYVVKLWNHRRLTMPVHLVDEIWSRWFPQRWIVSVPPPSPLPGPLGWYLRGEL